MFCIVLCESCGGLDNGSTVYQGSVFRKGWYRDISSIALWSQQREDAMLCHMRTNQVLRQYWAIVVGRKGCWFRYGYRRSYLTLSFNSQLNEVFGAAVGADPGREPQTSESLGLAYRSADFVYWYQPNFFLISSSDKTSFIRSSTWCLIATCRMLYWSPNSMTGTKVIKVAAKISLVSSPLHQHCFVDGCCYAIHLLSSLAAYESRVSGRLRMWGCFGRET